MMSSRTGMAAVRRGVGRGGLAGGHIRERRADQRERLRPGWRKRGFRGIVTAAATVAVSAAVLAPAPQAQASTNPITTYQGKVLTTLTVRKGPTTAAIAVGTLRTGATITLLCKVNGEVVDGNPLWYKLGFRQWAAARYVANIGAAPPFCPSEGTPTYQGKLRKDFTARSAPTLKASGVALLREGTVITLQCKVYGDSVYGNYLWYKQATGKWVTAYYVVLQGAAPPFCGNGHLYTGRATTGLNVRSGPNTGDQVVGSVSSGATVNLICKVDSQVIDGNSLWYELPGGNSSNGGRWVTARYVANVGAAPPSC